MEEAYPELRGHVMGLMGAMNKRALDAKLDNVMMGAMGQPVINDPYSGPFKGGRKGGMATGFPNQSEGA